MAESEEVEVEVVEETKVEEETKVTTKKPVVKKPVLKKPVLKKQPTKKQVVKKATAEVKKALTSKTKVPVKKVAKKVAAEDKPKGVKWTHYRIKIVKALQSMNAIDMVSAKSVEKLVKKTGLSESNIRHYCGAAQSLVQCGIVKHVKIEDEIGHSYHLTKKGADLEVPKE